ncbi:hypothetical protein [Serratia marcescens]|uniref:Uncharacterized protein n=1 Tax=Serratia marcescens TaxID=615 RepID=A0A9X8VJA8_SERMA|nr:hypothetical protein [Serratia marcescens]MBS3892317.1 hypothetical protein [Serratia marcescens]
MNNQAEIILLQLKTLNTLLGKITVSDDFDGANKLIRELENKVHDELAKKFPYSPVEPFVEVY